MPAHRVIAPPAVVAVAAFAAFLAIVPISRGAAAEDVVPSGRIQTQTRTPGHFVRVAVGGPFDVELRQGTREAVTITGDENLLAQVQTTVDDDDGVPALTVKFRHDVHTSDRHTRMKLVVEVVRLDALRFGGIGDVVARNLRTDELSVVFGGAGRIDLAGLAADRLSLTIGGAGSIRVDGRVHQTRLVIAGSGTCDCDALAASNMHITIAGSGNAHVRVDRSLDVTIAGSGNVVYRGDVEPTTTIIGTGRIARAA